MDCSEVIDQWAEVLDDDAREENCRTIEEHLSQCRDCRFKVDTVRKTIVLYQAENKQVELPVKVSDQLKVALRQAYGG